MPRAVDGELQSAVDTLQARVSADPEIQALLQRHRARLQQTRDRGGAARDFQQTIRDQITSIAKRKGYLPRGGQYFVNPNDGQLEPHGGWAGLSNKTRLAIIAAAATGGALGLGALGVGPAAGMFTSSAGGVVAPAATGAVAPAAAGGLGSLAKWSIVGALGNAGANMYGAHRQAGASRYAADLEARSYDDAMRETQLQREDDQRRWEAEQEFESKKWAASEDERLFNRRLIEDREARREPYRQASRMALGRLSDLLQFTGGAPQQPWRSPSNVGRPGYGANGARLSDLIVRGS